MHSRIAILLLLDAAAIGDLVVLRDAEAVHQLDILRSLGLRYNGLLLGGLRRLLDPQGVWVRVKTIDCTVRLLESIGHLGRM